MKTKFFCHGFLRNSKNEILVLKRKKTGIYPNKWDLPGGFNEQNETYEECVIREFKEETGLNVNINNLDEIKIQKYNGYLIVVLLYSVTCENIDHIVLDYAHADYKFINIDLFIKEESDDDLIWYLKNNKNSKKEERINYLFSCINSKTGFTKKQALYLKNDIMTNSNIAFISSNFDSITHNDKIVNDILKCFEKIGIKFNSCYIIDNRMNKNEIYKAIEDSNVVLLIGGDPQSQIKNINKYGLKKILTGYNGIVIGASAGAMNQSNRVVYIDGNNNIINYKGIGLVDLLIYPHVNIQSKENLDEILLVSKYRRLYCLPNDSFIRIKNDKIEIEGEYFVLGKD